MTVLESLDQPTNWAHIAQIYTLLARHVPENSNYGHSEVRVWRKTEGVFVLISARGPMDFGEHGRAVFCFDPDGNEVEFQDYFRRRAPSTSHE